MTVFNKIRKTAQTHATDAIAMKTFLAFFFAFSTAMRCSSALRSASKRSASALRSASSRSASSFALSSSIFFWQAYLRITELYKKWNGSKVQNWAMVRNQLATNDKIKARIEKYEHLI